MQGSQGEFELTKAPEFDHVVVNDDLAQAIEEATRILSDFSPDRMPAGKTRSKSDGYGSEPVPAPFADHSRPSRDRTKK